MGDINNINQSNGASNVSFEDFTFKSSEDLRNLDKAFGIAEASIHQDKAIDLKKDIDFYRSELNFVNKLIDEIENVINKDNSAYELSGAFKDFVIKRNIPFDLTSKGGIPNDARSADNIHNRSELQYNLEGLEIYRDLLIKSDIISVDTVEVAMNRLNSIDAQIMLADKTGIQKAIKGLEENYRFDKVEDLPHHFYVYLNNRGCFSGGVKDNFLDVDKVIENLKKYEKDLDKKLENLAPFIPSVNTLSSFVNLELAQDAIKYKDLSLEELQNEKKLTGEIFSQISKLASSKGTKQDIPNDIAEFYNRHGLEIAFNDLGQIDGEKNRQMMADLEKVMNMVINDKQVNMTSLKDVFHSMNEIQSRFDTDLSNRLGWLESEYDDAFFENYGEIVKMRNDLLNDLDYKKDSNKNASVENLVSTLQSYANQTNGESKISGDFIQSVLANNLSFDIGLNLTGTKQDFDSYKIGLLQNVYNSVVNMAETIGEFRSFLDGANRR